MKLYTRTGDKGQTGLLSGQRVEKDSLRVEAYGTVDEAVSVLGLARALATQEDVKATLLSLQRLLSLLMAELAGGSAGKAYLSEESTGRLEAEIDRYDAGLPPLDHFIVPGDTPAQAALDLGRTVIRRAERATVRLSRSEPVADTVLIALNRLSDLLFVLSRVEAERK